MAKLQHIKVDGTAGTLPYTSRSRGSGKFRCPPRDDRVSHAQRLRQELQNVEATIAAKQPVQTEDSHSTFVEFRSEPNFELKVDSLENRPKKIEVVNVHPEGDASVAVVRVPHGQMSFFFKRIDEYETKNTKSGDPQHKDLVGSISRIKLAAIRSFWTDAMDLYPNEGQAIWWEVWLRCPLGKEGDPIIEAFKQKAGPAIKLDDHTVRFRERAVLLARCTPEAWANAPDLIDDLAEMRKAKEPAGPYVALSALDQAAFVNSLLSQIELPPASAPSVCILDTGVDWGHPLLAVGINQTSALTADLNWRPTDHDGHGTEMAGLCLYGCLTKVFPDTMTVVLSHCLESVKILPPQDQGANDPKNYGAITQGAISRAEVAFPHRNRVVCMAVTADDRDQGFPTSWSAAIDQHCSGELDDKRRLLFVSAGNVRDLMSSDSGYQYPRTNHWQGIEDPAQSWNAVTVGGYTDLVMIRDATRQGWSPVAPKGSLCPTSRTSLPWGPDSEWPFKPDIVMEAGNWAVDSLGRIDPVEDLSLLTTLRRSASNPRLLTTFRDTSAATALAARMGARIQSRYPDYWPETIRGLMVHSAEWTPEMLAEFPYAAREDRLRCYGWGVPREEKATWSAENAVTLIFEGQLQPYFMSDVTKEGKRTKGIKTKDMHIHTLPWPKDVLDQFPSESVRMRVTLSYFIEPSPGRQGWTKKHRYASHGLRFDVKRPTESDEDFRNRLTREAQEEDEDGEQIEAIAPVSQAKKQPWILGKNLRTRGSIHSDYWEGLASDLAACGCIGIYPVTGWWRERQHLNRWDRAARYSLIVSLETKQTDIDLYTAIATLVGITPEIET